ncbi:MAG: type II toxin-antitoxin system prevent-host-death family antitoxin [Coriobacteriia bacterium]|nr:type II toxin-antitoxin system prevent-host-death family antitoxin [Coriobacteriia bacterium]
MLTFAVTEARANFASVLDKVQKGEHVGITKGGKSDPIVVMIPFEVYQEDRKEPIKLGGLAHWGVDVPFTKLSPEDLFDNPEEYGM